MFIHRLFMKPLTRMVKRFLVFFQTGEMNIYALRRWSNVKELPEGYCMGYLFNLAAGDALDAFAERYDLKRRRYWIFREPDVFYKNRIMKAALLQLERSVNGRG